MNLLELRAKGHGYREIAKLSGASRNTVRSEYEKALNLAIDAHFSDKRSDEFCRTAILVPELVGPAFSVLDMHFHARRAVVDTADNRVLRYKEIPTGDFGATDRVLGQDSIRTNSENR